MTTQRSPKTWADAPEEEAVIESDDLNEGVRDPINDLIDRADDNEEHLGRIPRRIISGTEDIADAISSLNLVEGDWYFRREV